MWASFVNIIVSLTGFLLLFTSVLPLEIQLHVSTKDGWNPITGLTPPQFCAYPKPEPGFQTPICCGLFFGFNGLRWVVGYSFCIQWFEMRGGLFVLLIISKISYHNNNYRECQKTVKIFRKYTRLLLSYTTDKKNHWFIYKNKRLKLVVYNKPYLWL